MQNRENRHSNAQKSQKNDDNIPTEKKKRCIIGDSLLGGINENGINKLSQNNNTKIKCHRGASSEDIINYINPVIRKKPDVVIMYSKMILILVKISTSPTTRILVSKLIVRKDNAALSKKVDEVNKRLDTICQQHNVNMITNENIKVSHPSAKKLHLNKSGSCLLARNFVDFIESF